MATYNAAVDLIERNLDAGRADKVAVYRCDQQATYGQIAVWANQVGHALRGLGVEQEDRVLLLLLDGFEFYASFLGAIKIGAIPIPTNTLMRGPDYAYFLNDSRARVLIVSDALWPEVASARDELRELPQVVVVGQPVEGLISYADWVQNEPTELEAANTDRDDACFWLYSSGSTGFPKGTVHLQHDMVYCLDNYAKPILNLSEQDITFSGAKLFFAYGLGNNLYFPFGAGASAVVYPGRPLPEAMFETIQRYRPTLFFGVPTLYAGMLGGVPDAEQRFDLSSLRLCVSAGESLPAEIFRQWRERFGLDILDGIGTTEACHIFISNRVGQIKPGSTGLAVPGYEVKLVDDEERIVPQGELGSLMVKGDSIAAYYWNKQDLSRRTFRGDWLFTGDKYVQDEDGFYWYAGRSDDMLKVGGIWVSPVEVESTLIMHPAVLEAAVVGQEDEEHLVKPKAFVVLKEGQSATATELQAFVKDRIAPYKYPRWIEFLPELPKTATGKIQRFKLRGM